MTRLVIATIPGRTFSRRLLFSRQALRALGSLPSTATPCRPGTCPGSPGDHGVQPPGATGTGRSQPSPRSARSFRAGAGFRFAFFPFCSRSSCRLRGGRGRDQQVQRRVRQRRGRAASSSSASSPPRPGPASAPTAPARSPVAGLMRRAVGRPQLLVPARPASADRQRPPVPARRARHQHRYHRRQLMADPQDRVKEVPRRAPPSCSASSAHS